MTQAPRQRGAFSDLWLEPFVAARTDPRHGLAESDRERLNLKAKRPQNDRVTRRSMVSVLSGFQPCHLF